MHGWARAPPRLGPKIDLSITQKYVYHIVDVDLPETPHKWHDGIGACYMGMNLSAIVIDLPSRHDVR